MKKSILYFAALASLLSQFDLEGTVSYLTSEKKHVSAVSTGTNQDVFVTDTEHLMLKTSVYKLITITKQTTQGEDGKPVETESRDVKVFVDRGAAKLTLFPQRPHLDLDVKNLKITGAAADEVKIQKVVSKEGIAFLLEHARDAIGSKSKTVKGELHITALGGFYHEVLPITIVTTYREKTDREEVIGSPGPSPDGSPPATPGTPPTSPPVPDKPPQTDGSPPPVPDKSPQTDDSSPPVPDKSPQTDDSSPPDAETPPTSSDTPAEPPASPDGGEEQSPEPHNTEPST